MVEDWIDALCKVWEISDQRFGTVKSYRMVGDAAFPNSIDALDLDLHPVAFSFVTGMGVDYSEGGPLIARYNGQTEFHVASDVNKARMPMLMPWYGKIVKAAAGSMKLGGVVDFFMLSDADEAISGAILQYGSENPHFGFVVRWIVSEHLNSQVTVGR